MNFPRVLFRLLVPAVVAIVTTLSATEAPRPWGPNPFAALTPERIAQLPPEQRSAWQDYWDASQKLAAEIPVAPTPEFSPMQPLNAPPRGGAHTKGLRLNALAAWYASAEARAIADRVVASQTAAGAWVKGNDYTRPESKSGEGGVWARGTLDNDATIYELRFLVAVQASADAGVAASAVEAWRESFHRGLAYVFAAQYPNGGFPQVYPLTGSYHDGVTFNDDAMVHALELLRDVAAGKPEFAFVSDAVRAESAERFQRGLRCVLATQLHGLDGKPTVWCQQYDPLTLRPQAARNFEPIADVSLESASIVALLMSLPKPSREITEAVEGAMAWFQRTALHDLTWVREPAKSRGEVLAQPGAPLLWARYYLPGTTTPIFGDRDRTIHFAVAEISSERRAGYGWYGTWPAAVLAEYPAWRARVGLR